MPERSILFRLRAPVHPISVSAARHLVRGLDRWLDTATIERAELATSELVTNAIRHGSPSDISGVEVDVEVRPQELSVSVRDEGPAFAEPTALPSPGATGGFGLHVARGLSDSFNVSRHASGNEVTFTVAAHGARLLDATFGRHLD